MPVRSVNRRSSILMDGLTGGHRFLMIPGQADGGRAPRPPPRATSRAPLERRRVAPLGHRRPTAWERRPPAACPRCLPVAGGWRRGRGGGPRRRAVSTEATDTGLGALVARAQPRRARPRRGGCPPTGVSAPPRQRQTFGASGTPRCPRGVCVRCVWPTPAEVPASPAAV